MNDFIHSIPTKVYFGRDQLSNLGTELSKYGKRVLLAYGGGSIKQSGLYDAVISEIKKEGLILFELSGIEPNPRIDSVREGAKLCKKEDIDVILAVGGGSTIDAAKYMAAGACVDFDPWKFFSEWAPIKEALPVVTILTLSATGSEMNAGGVISNLETNDKIGRIAPPLLPKASFLNPELTFSVPSYHTACGAADIISHILEAYFNPGESMFMLDRFMEGMIKTVIKYAPIAMKDPENYEARANLMWTSSWAINGFCGSQLSVEWTCHPIEHELSAFYDITHGHGLAILTPRWMKYCLSEKNISRYVDFGVNVFDIDKALPELEIATLAIEKLSEFFFKTLGLKSKLSELGIGRENFGVMAEKACEGKMLRGFRPLSKHDIKKIFEMCL